MRLLKSLKINPLYYTKGMVLLFSFLVMLVVAFVYDMQLKEKQNRFFQEIHTIEKLLRLQQEVTIFLLESQHLTDFSKINKVLDQIDAVGQTLANDSLNGLLATEYQIIERYKSHQAVLNNSKIFIMESMGKKGGTVENIALQTVVFNEFVQVSFGVHNEDVLSEMLSQVKDLTELPPSLVGFFQHMRIVQEKMNKMLDIQKQYAGLKIDAYVEEIRQQSIEKNKGYTHTENLFLYFYAFLMLVMLIAIMYLYIKEFYIKAQLKELNSSLEQRIENEVKKGHEKDKVLMTQSKNAAMGEMIGSIAHQWRQPLNALGLRVQDIEDAYAYDELDEVYIKEMVKKSMELINHMSKTIDDFRSFFVPNKETALFDVKQSIQESLSILSSVLSAHYIQVDIKGESFSVEGYQNEFKQVIINILNNAKDAFISQNTSNPVLDITLTDTYISIEDNAGGIPKEVISRIFEPYFTTKFSSQGTGIGLYMSKNILEGMNGQIEVENTDKGAKFSITF